MIPLQIRICSSSLPGTLGAGMPCRRRLRLHSSLLDSGSGPKLKIAVTVKWSKVPRRAADASFAPLSVTHMLTSLLQSVSPSHHATSETCVSSSMPFIRESLHISHWEADDTEGWEAGPSHRSRHVSIYRGKDQYSSSEVFGA